MYRVHPFCLLLHLALAWAAQHRQGGGLFPEAFNLAGVASIETNATCGERGPETFCKLRSGHQCGVCDARSADKKHPVKYAVDTGQDTWWQSPTLHSGPHYEHVTLTLDLRQVYQVLHVRVRAGNSPRPGDWVLERSTEGSTFKPWQYFATSGEQCWAKYGLRPHHGHYPLKTDSEVLCTTAFSKVTPVDSGEIHTSLTQGRPGWNVSSAEHLEFTKARYIRLRLQKLNTVKVVRHGGDLSRRLYYSIKDILIQGRCICNGHASKCRHNHETGEASCECQHNTCGASCEKCCPMFNQELWRGGTLTEANPCVKCQCHGHATACRYSPEVAAAQLSLNARGNYSGGGECINCSKHTTGVNCERCEDGYFRPPGVRPDAAVPCIMCDCHSIGSTGICTKDDSQAHLGKPAGTCVCREGYMGMRCDRCAPGYKGFPHCKPCPCNVSGMQPGSSCDHDCTCKMNVEGEQCDRCKPGFFFLDRDNPDGCTECYCSGVATVCKEAVGYKLHEITTMEGWKVCDLSTSLIVQPYTEPGSNLISIANFQLPGVESYYWMAPREYRGNKLTSYGSTMTFTVSWDIMRGDTSGKPTTGPDLVLIGTNGMRIGYGDTWHKNKNMSITVALSEEGWYHVLDGVKDIVTRLRRNEADWEDYRGADITRAQFMSVLGNIKHLLVRAKFHSDQAEGSLDSFVMETGALSSSGTSVGFLEQCACPGGYTGLSCESCDFGYARIIPENSSPRQHAVCTKCNCHGHAATCDPITGQCGDCEHNTVGANCERCAAGYYGDASVGTPNDCRVCACPLIVESNNFSPSCEADHLGYICTSCPPGHTGRHCERCEAGYFGNPEEIGSQCRRCECNEGPCDPFTGQCLSCHGNTEGWRCDRCKPNHYGDPLSTGCFSCQCSEIGTVNGETCDMITGQCKCKEKYTGRMCDRCQTGLGNVTVGCIPCQCDTLGSSSSLCDPITGDCICHPGVSGPLCESCLPNHYAYSHTGCKRCDCNTIGSLSLECEAFTGQCTCGEKITGRTCDSCQVGYWGLSQSGCQPCDCDPLGSKDATCDVETGQCFCKPGVGGIKCDRCLPLYYGMSSEGCSECDECSLPGHICDPDTGRCVCPPLTSGTSCETCIKNTWGYHPQKGCKTCECDSTGSMGGQCDVNIGRCMCKEGYHGNKCDSCSRGYYGYPRCRQCDCSLGGTNPQHCHAGICDCDHNGQCPCKENVEGLHCDKCKDGTFGLNKEDSVGCTQCFCFGRSTKCTDAGLTWGQIRIPRPRMLIVNYDNDTSAYNGDTFPVNTQEICYINLAIPGSNGVLTKNARKLNVTNNLRIIPSDDGDIELGVSYLFYTPVYWQLPRNFLGDKILSYGGFFRFTVETEGETTLLPPSVLDSYPLIQIQGNDRVVLEHFPFIKSTSDRHHVRLHESLWRVKNNPKGKVSREMLMVALQNLQHVLIRASDSVDFKKASLRDVTLDTAVPAQSQTSPLAKAVELCECPNRYNASSCQNPSFGFYRSKSTVTSTVIIELVGEAMPCQCNYRSDVCQIETGYCIDCRNNTGGSQCERCAEGYYGEPENGVECQPCPCPSIHQNFASSCEVRSGKNPVCHCKPGYTGPYCDRCSYGWFGYPKAEGGSCEPCKCNAFGSVSDECHEEKGQCNCKANVTGRDCSQCLYPREVLTDHRGCTRCDDKCITQLLDRMDKLADQLDKGTRHIAGGVISPPWETLLLFDQEVKHVHKMWSQHANNIVAYEQFNSSIDKEYRHKLKNVQNKIKKIIKKSDTIDESMAQLKTETENTETMITNTRKDIDAALQRLEAYIEGDQEQQVSINAMLYEARQLLARVRDTDLEPTRNRAEEVLRSCRFLLSDLQYEIGDQNDIEQYRNRIDQLMMRNEDFLDIIANSSQKVDMIISKGDYIRGVTENVKIKSKEIIIIGDETNDLLNSTKYLNQLSDIYVREASDNYEDLASLRKTLQITRKSVEKKRNTMDQMSQLYKEQYVIPAQEHADYLMNISKKFTNLLKTDASYALKASKAYQDIVNMLNEAWQAAQNASKAANVAYEKAYPGIGTDSLVDQAVAVKEVSIELKRSAQDQLSRVYDLQEELSDHKEAVKELGQKIIKTADDNNAIVKQLQQLSSQSVQESTSETVAQAEDLIEMSEQVQDDVAYVNHSIHTKLRQQLRQLESDGEVSLNKAQEIIGEAQATNRKAQEISERLSYTVRKQDQIFNEWNDSIASKLEELRNKIMQARHIAESIRLSMTSIGDSDGSCVRTYQPSHLEPSTMTTIVLTYAISSQLRDALLFYLPSSTTDDFVAVEMVNRKMRFVWNVGGGLGEVTHPLHIQTAGDLNKDQHWYRVEAQRMSNVGRLWVRPQVLPEGSPLATNPPAVNASAPGIGRFDVGTGDRVWVGGADRRHPHLMSTQPGLVGCLHHLYLNGRPIGLWDFRTQNPNSCTACIEGAEESKDDSSYSFTGDGYAVLKHDVESVYNKYLFSISFEFRTFDHNALLYLAVSKNRDRFISLSLSEGRLVFRISYGGDSSLEMSTTNKYNNGNWTRVEASRYFDRKKKLEKGVLKVGDEVRDGAPTPPPSQDAIPDMSTGEYYVGGVPPGKKVGSTSLPQPFLGCMSDLQIAQEGYNPLKGQYWGVQASCSKKPLTVVGFHGNGFLELPSYTLKKKGSFGFVFSTSQQNALLMLTTFEGLTRPLEDKEEITNLIEQEERLSYYSVSLRRGQIDVRLNGGRGEVRLASVSSEYSDSRFHSVSITKNGRRLELRVDDSLDTVTTLPEGGGTTLKAPGQTGGLYFGGLPPGFNTTGRTFSNVPLVGTIKDAIFNDMIVGFDKVLNFEEVTIGRFGPTDQINELPGTGMTTRGVVGCRKVTSYTLEPGAVKFGDSSNTHVQINFRKKSILQRNFTLELDFRTFHPNGLLFMIPGVRGKHPHYLMAALRNGRVQIVLKGRRKIETTAQAVFNDGVWHRMVLEKQGRNMILRVDSIDPERSKTPKKMNVGSIVYIGGLPQTGVMLPEPLLHKLEGFKGCIRGLRMNNRDEDLVGDKSTPFRVGQCFPQVERGSYFPGDAYAIYKTKFNVGAFLELELEFRTSELNGVLLSVAESDGYPALSLELHNGKVVMGGDMGDRRPFKVELAFPSEYTACDNRWHRLVAQFVNDQLSLRVDSHDQNYWLSDNGHLTQATTNSPLYIGGLPEHAPSGTLQSRENFKGCIRNVIINGERRDWTDMAALHNILLSSCPVTT